MRLSKRDKSEYPRRAHLSEEVLVTVVAAKVQQQVRGGGGCPSEDGPEEGKGQQGVGGEEREDDVPGMIALRPAEHADEDLQVLREPADHRQVPVADRQSDRHLRRLTVNVCHGRNLPSHLSHCGDVITSFLVSVSTQIPAHRTTDRPASQSYATPHQPDGHVSSRMSSRARMSITLVTTSEVLLCANENCW